MDGQGGILRLCRLCLVKDKVNIPIFEQQGDTRQIFLKISSCLAVKISREDKLPKNICEGCSDKLDSIFEFWNSSANAEKTLLSWLEQEEEKTGLIDQIPIEGLVKEETETLKNVNNETDPLPRKRARHTAAVKAQINITQELEDLITTQSLTKMEDESEVTDGEDKDPSYTEIPDNSDEDHQAGPSGVGKDGVESSEKSSSRRRVQCHVCQRRFTSKQQLQHHLKNLTIKVVSKCPNDFDDQDATLLHHCELCGLQILEPFQYHVCFHTNLRQRRNLEVKLEPSDLNFEEEENEECIYCNRTVPATRLNTHESWHRKFDKTVKDLLETRPFRMRKENDGLCAYCGVMKPGNKLRKHEYVEHVKRYVKKVCDVCGIFTCPTYIKEHMRTHGAERGFKCTDCGKAFFRKKALARHRLVHSDEARYVCTVCGKSFKIKFNLRVHMRSHDDVKPFPCSVCKKTFTTKQWRDNHLKTHGIVANK